MKKIIFLKQKELVEAISAEDRSKLVIGGYVKDDHLHMIRADKCEMVLPISWFAPAGDGTAADFSQLSFEDHGQTIKCGDYEACAEFALSQAKASDAV